MCVWWRKNCLIIALAVLGQWPPPPVTVRLSIQYCWKKFYEVLFAVLVIFCGEHGDHEIYNWDEDAEKTKQSWSISWKDACYCAFCMFTVDSAVGSCVLKEFTSVPDPVRKARMVIVTSWALSWNGKMDIFVRIWCAVLHDINIKWISIEERPHRRFQFSDTKTSIS